VRQKGVLGVITGPKGEGEGEGEVTEEWNRLRGASAGHVACEGDKRNVYRI
jgi:hypothetical protein